jgi:hypothetical protein
MKIGSRAEHDKPQPASPAESRVFNDSGLESSGSGFAGRAKSASLGHGDDVLEWFETISRLPLVLWIAVLAAIALIIRFWTLRRMLRDGESPSPTDHLIDVFLSLRRYHQQTGRLPAQLKELPDISPNGLAWRPISGVFDERLLVVHDDEPRRRVIEFPNIRSGRAVLFWSGRTAVVSESAFEKLIAADDALRERLTSDGQPSE